MRSATLDRPSMGEPKLREKTWEPAYEEDVLKAWRAEPGPVLVSPRPRAPALSGGPRRHVGGLRPHVLHGFRRVPRVQPSNLPRAVAERALLSRRAPDVLVSRLRDTARRSRHRLRGAALEPRVDEVPAHVERGDPDRDDATGAARGVPGGNRPSRRCPVRGPPRQEGPGPAVRS